MDSLEQVAIENKQIALDINQLAGTEESRLSVITAIFVRLNNEMRLQNVQDIRKDISYRAKDYGLLPDKYVNSLDSIVRLYIQETNEFMKYYNEEFLNIQNVLKRAEESQKYYFFKIRETIVMKNICELAEKNPEDYSQLDEQIKEYRKKLAIYEKILIKCDKEFEECKNRREQDFKDLFEIKQEQALVVIKKRNIFSVFFSKILNKFNGYENFSRFVLQKHSSKLNRMKTETLGMYSTKVKQAIVNFNSEIEVLLKS